MADKENKKHQTDEEATQANKAIQEEFYDDNQESDETSSPVPYVANNTAPLPPKEDHKDKDE